MNRFTKRSKDMDPKLEAFAYPTLDLKIARFIELHVNSEYNTITFTPERFKELTEYVGRKTLISYYNLKPLQDANIIKFVWTNNAGRRVYMMNPAWSSQFNDADEEKYTDLYNRYVDGEVMNNIKVKYSIINTEDELGDTEESKEEEGSNKSNHKQEEPKGETVYHPEEEVVVKKEENSGNTGESEGKEESNKSINGGEEPKGEPKEIVQPDPEEEARKARLLNNLKNLNYDIDHKDSPNTKQIRRAKGEFYSRTKKDLGSFVNMEYAVIKDVVVGRCDGWVEIPDVLAYDEQENKTYLQISRR